MKRRTSFQPPTRGVKRVLLGTSAWALAIVLLPAAACYRVLRGFPVIDESVAVLVSTAFGVGAGVLIGMFSYRLVLRLLDPTPRCRCGYDIRGLEASLCPECGEYLP